MQKVMRGTIHGRTIELEDDPQLADGITVEIVLRIKELPGPPPGWKPGTRETAAGMMAGHWTEADDRILQEISQDRQRDRRREPAE